VVHAPALAPAGAADPAAVQNPDEPWYGQLWSTLAADGAP